MRIKTVTKSKKVSIKSKIYTAKDGKEFNDFYKCLNYEEKLIKSECESNLLIKEIEFNEDKNLSFLLDGFHGYEYEWVFICRVPEIKNSNIDLFYKYFGVINSYFSFNNKGKEIIPKELSSFFKKCKRGISLDLILYIFSGRGDSEYKYYIYKLDDRLLEILNGAKRNIKAVENFKFKF